MRKVLRLFIYNYFNQNQSSHNMPKTLFSQFLGLYRVILVKNHPVSVILGNSYPLSWNFNFCRNLTDIEIGLLERLVSFLNSVHFSSFAVDSKAWSLSSSDLFILTYFFLALSNFSNPIRPIYCVNQKPLQRSRPLLG